MPRWIPVALVLSLLLNAFFVAGFVFRGWIAPLPFAERSASPPAPGARLSALETVAKEIKLDDRQRDSLRDVMEQHIETRRERSRAIQGVREQILAEYKRIPLDQARLDPLIDKLGDLRVEQQKETVRALSAMEAQLGPEQRQRMHEVLVDRILSSPWSRQQAAPRPSQ